MSNVVDKQLGYLERAAEEHTKDIDSLYDLVAKHMDEELIITRAMQQKFVAIEKKFIVIICMAAAALLKDLPWSQILQLLV